MGGKTKEITSTQPQKEPCRHYWVIDVADGPVSRGTCKFCGAQKDFYNAFPEFNPLRKGTNPFSLPGLDEVKKGSKSLISG